MTFEMLSPEQIQDLDSDFLNIDVFFANNDDDDNRDDLWVTPRRDASGHSSADDDWLSSELDPLMEDPEEAVPAQTKQSSPSKSLLPNAAPTRLANDSKSRLKAEPISVDHDDDEMREVVACDGDDERIDMEGCHGDCGHYVPGDVQSDAEGLLDDAGWLDFDRMPLVSPSVPLREPARDKNLLSPNVKSEENVFDQDDGDFCLPELTDDDMSALVGSTPSDSSCTSSSLPPGSTRNNAIDVSPVSTPTSPAFQLNTPPKVLPARKVARAPARPAASSLKASEKDIPAMVSMFNSMYSPSGAAHSSSAKNSRAAIAPQPPTACQGPSLSILVPTPQVYSNVIPFSTAAASAAKPAPATSATAAATMTSSSTSGTGVNQFDYFTPPGYSNNARYLEGAAQLSTSHFVHAAEALSPTAKTAMFPGGVAVTAQSRAAYAQVQAQAAAAAAAVVMANSAAAAISTMRKINTTYGVPIAPLQRSLHPELKPKAPVAVATASSLVTAKTLLAAATSSTSKVTKIAITPDISDFKLVQIFHSFCDPANKLINVVRFHQLLHHHQGKDEMHAIATVAKTTATAVVASSTSSSSGGVSTGAKPLAISQETQRLFKVLDPRGTGFIDLERFMSSFQICNRCTEAKRRAQSAAHSQPVAATAVERQLMEDVAPVIVRVVPTSHEGSKVRSCEHYQWTWCEGFEKTGNEKCRGTNRHDKCPKYLANCTLWKHKLPPKNRKAKVPENLESPTKKLKHFA